MKVLGFLQAPLDVGNSERACGTDIAPVGLHLNWQIDLVWGIEECKDTVDLPSRRTHSGFTN